MKAGAKITQGLIREIKIPRQMTLAGLIRNGKGMLISGNTQLMPGDHVLVFCLSGSLHKIEKLFN